MICRECRHWAIDAESLKIKDPLERQHGYCHRYPPPHISDTAPSRFPPTTDSDWCGEFQAKRMGR